MSIQFRDNSGNVRHQMAANIARALAAMGEVGLETVIDQMNVGYGEPIYLTGDLQRSVIFETDAGKQTTTWGSNLEYAPHVHEGTSRMAGRPFLKDGLLNNKDLLREVAIEELKREF